MIEFSQSANEIIFFNFTSIPYDYLLISWVTNYAHNREFVINVEILRQNKGEICHPRYSKGPPHAHDPLIWLPRYYSHLIMARTKAQKPFNKVSVNTARFFVAR